MKMLTHNLTKLALASGLVAALGSSGASGDYLGGHDRVENVVEYQIFLDAEQAKLDREQAAIDRQQAALDRRKARWRSEVEDATWRFRMLDANDDALISDTEANAMPVVDRQFDALDTDNNNMLTATEFMALTLRVGQ